MPRDYISSYEKIKIAFNNNYLKNNNFISESESKIIDDLFIKTSCSKIKIRELIEAYINIGTIKRIDGFLYVNLKSSSLQEVDVTPSS